MMYYKVFSHDLRPPIQGGSPVWDGSTPYDLPPVDLDMSDSHCGAGWNCCSDAATALRIAGLWADGRPARLFVVTPGSDAVTRVDKTRASTMRIVRECSRGELADAIRAMSAPFGVHADAMAASQLEWHTALGRPLHDATAVESHLRAALGARELSAWSLRMFRSARDARDAWAAWDARDARDAWAEWAARDAWDARDARDALTVQYASLCGWITTDPHRLTTGIKEAYRHGLALAIPTGPKELGWAMVDP